MENHEEETPKSRSYTRNFRTIDDSFMSQPRYIPVLQKFIHYIKTRNLRDGDMQSSRKIERLLQYAFENSKNPIPNYIKSVKTLFQNDSIEDFMKHLYRHSELIATYLWVDRVQTIVEDPKEKNRILRGQPVNLSGYKLFCFLRNIEYFPQKNLISNHEVKLFGNILRCKDKLSEGLEAFINSHFREDFTEEEKNEITNCTRKFLNERIKFNKTRRSTNSPAFGKSTIVLEDDSDDIDNEKEDEDDLENESAAQETPRETRSNSKRKATEESTLPSDSTSSCNTEKEPVVSPKKPKTEDHQECHSTFSRTPEIVIDPTDDNDVEQEQANINSKEDPLPENSKDDESDKVFRNYHRRSIIDGLYRKWKNQEDCDVEFLTADDRKIKAHKLILSTGSSIFSGIFNIRNKNDPLSTDMSYDVIEEMLHFMYSGELRKLDQNKACGLLMAATKYKIDNLKLACEKYLMKNINIVNAVVTSKLSHEYDLHELKNVSDEFIRSNAKKVCFELLSRKEFDEKNVHYYIIQSLKSRISIPN